MLEVAQRRADARISALTDGEVRKCTEAARLVGWLQRRGIPADSIAKDEHADLIRWADMLGDDVALEVIQIRADNGKSSTAKFDTMLEVASADGGARGQFRYHQAHTGRWAGGGIQVHNLKQIGEDEDLDDVLGAMQIMERIA